MPTSGAGLTKIDMEELEKIKQAGIQELEQRMMDEVRKRSEASSVSYRTLPTVQDAEAGKGVTHTGNGVVAGAPRRSAVGPVDMDMCHSVTTLKACAVRQKPLAQVWHQEKEHSAVAELLCFVPSSL